MEQEKDYMNVMEFQTLYPSKEEKIKALTEMTDEQINYLIETSNNIYGKIFYSSYNNSIDSDEAEMYWKEHH